MTTTKKTLANGFYEVAQTVPLQFFCNGEAVIHSLKEGEKVLVEVVYDKLISGNITSTITTNIKLKTIIKGDVLNDHASGIKFK